MSKETAKIIRIFTAPPVLALILIVLLRLCDDSFFINDAHFWLFAAFLVILPACVYPFTSLIPALKAKGRDFERKVAIAASLTGYVGAFLVAVAAGGTSHEKVLSSTYLMSALFTALFTILKIKTSGHTCALSGPVAMLCYCVSPWFAFGYLLLLPVFVSSVKLGRHTPFQLISGALVPIVAMACSILIFA